MYAEAILKKGEGRTLKSGGAWVYDNEIDRVEGDYENGDILAVKDFDGFFLGWGFINTRSKITIRVMSRRKEHEITEEFLEKRTEYRLPAAPACHPSGTAGRSGTGCGSGVKQ